MTTLLGPRHAELGLGISPDYSSNRNEHILLNIDSLPPVSPVQSCDPVVVQGDLAYVTRRMFRAE